MCTTVITHMYHSHRSYECLTDPQDRLFMKQFCENPVHARDLGIQSAETRPHTGSY